MDELLGYLIEPNALKQLRKIADELQGGSDKERDIGHRIWLLVNNTEPIRASDLNYTGALPGT